MNRFAKARSAIILFALLIVSVLLLGLYVVNDVTHGVNEGAGERVRVSIARGTPFAAAVQELQKQGLIRRAWTLTFFAQATGADRKMHRGTYEFVRGSRPVDMLRALVKGDILTVRVTIPEGFTMWQVASAFQAAGIDSQATLAAIRDPELIRSFQVPGETLEGYLYPDTYLVPFGSVAGDVVAQMLTRFHAVWTPEFDARAREISMTRHEVVTLASIIEAEARVPAERPLVSAVYHNRLMIGMKLDADPTVAYAKGGYHGRLYYKDLDVDSPYNTYRHPGLPPGPIGNPGVDSIRAALYPDETCRALYFVARGDGHHEFSVTLREHEAAVRRARAATNGGSK